MFYTELSKFINAQPVKSVLGKRKSYFIIKLDSNNHSVFLMYYHLVLVVKYRREVFDDKVSDYAKDMFVKLGEKYNGCPNTTCPAPINP